MAQQVSDVTTTDSGWNDVDAESQVRFDTIGDVFIGRLLGYSETDNGIPQAHFDSPEVGKVFINCGWDLKRQLKLVKTGKMVRVELTDLQDTGKDSPMQLFKVQWK